MYDYIKGKLAHKGPTYVVIEAAGVGYHVVISLNTFEQIKKQKSVNFSSVFRYGKIHKRSSVFLNRVKDDCLNT